MEIKKLLSGISVLSSHLTREHVTGITSDSRRARDGYMFVCVRGQRHDGHMHAAEAVSNGASVVVCESAQWVPAEADWILCPDTRLAEALLWNNWYDNPGADMQTVAITGSNGKTTVAYVLRELLAGCGRRVGEITTICARAGDLLLPMETGGTSVSDAAGAMTTPDPEYFYGAIAKMRDAGCNTLVYEASSHALDLRKTDALRPDVGIFTNLSPEHLDYHHTMEAYLKTKARLFTMVKTGICNVDDPYCSALMAAVPDCHFLTCTADPAKFASAHTTAMRYQSLGMDGITFLYCGKEAIFRIRTPYVGKHSLYNITEAVCTALHLGAHPAVLREVLHTLPPVSGRMERVPLPKGIPFAVFLDYAHTPAALESVLRTAIDMHPSSLTVVFGCGGDRDKGKRPLMGEIAGRYASKVVLTGDNPRGEDPLTILREIESGMGKNPPYAVIPDRKEAIFQVIREAKAGEMILLCGKGHEKYEITGCRKTPFDEAALVRQAVGENLHKYTDSN